MKIIRPADIGSIIIDDQDRDLLGNCELFVVQSAGGHRRIASPRLNGQCYEIGRQIAQRMGLETRGHYVIYGDGNEMNLRRENIAVQQRVGEVMSSAYPAARTIRQRKHEWVGQSSPFISADIVRRFREQGTV